MSLMEFPQADTLSTAILEMVHLPLLAMNADLRVETANDAFFNRHLLTSY